MVLLSIMHCTSAEAIKGIMTVCYPDARTVLDVTWGKGNFWTELPRQYRKQVIGSDIARDKAKDVVADFTQLPFKNESVSVVVFDPPFHTDMGMAGSIMGTQFTAYRNLSMLEEAVTLGCQEAWRIAQLGVIVKVQDYIHGSEKVWMSQWVHDSMPVPPYDMLMVEQPRKLIDPKWTRQLSVWTNHSTFWMWRKDGPKHIPRGKHKRK